MLSDRPLDLSVGVSGASSRPASSELRRMREGMEAETVEGASLGAAGMVGWRRMAQAEQGGGRL